LIELLNNLLSIVIDTIAPLGIIALLFIPFIVLSKYMDYRLEKSRLALRWKKLEKRIAEQRFRELIQEVTTHLKVELDTNYPLVDSSGELLKHQPLASKVVLRHLEDYLNKTYGYPPVPVRPDAFRKRTNIN